MPKELRFHRPGTRMELQFDEVPRTEPVGREVRYRVLAFALNRGDLFYVADTYYNSPSFPARIGQEAAGVVEAVGEDVTQFKVGDFVSSIPQVDGRYCVNGEVATSLEQYLMKWPPGFNAIDATSVWSSAITAYYPFVELATVGVGSSVLVTAGSSTVGTGAIQFAKLLGAQVIATTTTPEKIKFLTGVGADEVLLADSSTLAEDLLDISGGAGINVVFDSVAGTFIQGYAEALAIEANVFIVGALGGSLDLNVPVLPLARTGTSITGLSIFNHHPNLAQFSRAKLCIAAALSSRKFVPIVDSVFAFEDAIDAYGYMESGAQRGKIVVRTCTESESLAIH